jgi:hypothetical protein
VYFFWEIVLFDLSFGNSSLYVDFPTVLVLCLCVVCVVFIRFGRKG